MKALKVTPLLLCLVHPVWCALLAGPAAASVSSSGSSSDGTIHLSLESHYLPEPAGLPTKEGQLEFRSLRVRGQISAEGSGEGSVVLDPRSASLNPFGDVVDRTGPEPHPIRVLFRRVKSDEVPMSHERLRPKPDSPDWQDLYEVVFPESEATGTVWLKLGSRGSGFHRLLVYAGESLNRAGLSRGPRVLTLAGEPTIPLGLPDRPWPARISLSGYYHAPEGAYRRIAVEGRPGGEGRFSLDPNTITLNAFGEPAGQTSMGFRPQPVTIEPVEIDDPLGLGRRLYQIRSEDPRNTNRVFLVLGSTEAASSHRLLLYQGDQVRMAVPMVEPERRRQEAAAVELDGTTPQEQQAIAGLRDFIGYHFHYEVANGRVSRLQISGGEELSALDASLAGLTHLAELSIQGRLSAPGLPSLSRLPELQRVAFSGVEFEPEATAFLQHLGSLESVNFYGCTGVDDQVLGYLSNLSQLRFIRIYSDPPPPGMTNRAGITDRGVAALAELTALDRLSLSGEGITDAGMASLVGLTNLTHLSLYHTRVTLPALIQFAVSSSLIEIRAQFADPSSEAGGFEVTLEPQNRSAALEGGVPERALQQISAWRNLRRLRANALTTIADDDLRHLAGLADLESLSLANGHQLTDEGLKHLRGLIRLRELSLFACPKLTDDGLIHLQHLTALERLDLDQTRVTDAGIAALRKKLPHLQP
jgi:hypothetical protein